MAKKIDIREDIVIRKADRGDITSILDVQKHDGFDHTYYLSKDRLENLFRRDEMFYVAIVRGKLVGFASVDMEIRANLHFLSIDKDFQGRGLGTSLLKIVLQESVKRSCKSIFIYVEVDSLLEKFLLKKGFKKVGIYESRYAPGKDAHILAMDIGNNDESGN